MGNGAKAEMKREKNLKSAGKTGISQKAANTASLTVSCFTCKQAFSCTVRAPQLTEHALNKHNKPLLECFIGFVEPPPKK